MFISVVPMQFQEGSSTWCDSQGWGPVNENRISLTPCFLNTTLLGAPAIVAAIAFVLRISYLNRHGISHNLGHAFSYWPSQLAIGVAAGALIAHASAVAITSLSAWFAVGSQVLAWDQKEDTDNPLWLLYLYFSAILIAFFFEALPRGRSHVQMKSNASHHDKANLFSRWTFHYIHHIILMGFKRPLVTTDIQDIMPKDVETQQGYQLLANKWKANKDAVERKNLYISDKKKVKTPNLLLVIGRTFSWSFVTATATILAASSLQFLLPVLIKEILEYIESDASDEPKARGVILALGMFFISVAVSFLNGQYLKQIAELSLKIRSGLVAMIYRKALVLSPDSRNKASTGSITNHMSTDAERWIRDLVWMPHWISIPFEILVATAMLYQILGWSVFCGLFMIVIVTPFQAWAGKFFEGASGAKYEAMDRRVLIMSELLSHIKTIKLYGYEPAFNERVTSYRTKEIKLLRKSGLVLSFLSIVFTCLPLFMAFVSFAVYATVGGPGFSRGEINAQVVFVSMSLFSLLNRPVGFMSRVTETTIGLRVSTRRIQKFLLKEELDSSAVPRISTLPKDPQVPLVQIENATFAWNGGCVDGDDDDDSDNEEEPDETTALLSANTEPTLIDINVSMTRGSLTAVVGRVGQGKSSLLSAIIGDMYKRQGVVKVYGSVAYVPQQAWIINATVRDNIIFGKPFDQERYDRVLFASGLLPDLEILAAGDLTEIGERGINLSGGQKQRVSLARAAYQDVDIYLLDDPLSAVDAHVDQHLWQNLIGPHGLLKDKTRILITHGIHHLEHVDHILVMNNGKIEERGHYKHLMDAKDTFYRLISEFSVGHRSKKKHQKATGFDGTDEGETSTVVSEEENDEKDGELVEEEDVQTGVVGWSTFKVYCEAMSYHYLALTAVLYIIWEAFQLGIPVWLEHWTRVVDTTTHSLSYFLAIYAALVITYMIVDVYLTYVSNVQARVRASKVLHESVLARVLRLPMSFFDVTPQGRVLNRFSSDVSDIDEVVPEGFIDVLTSASNMIGVLAILVFATPLLIIVLPIIGLVYVIIQKYYIKTSSQIKRLQSISKSPLYQHFGETLNGISSIRAMGIKDRFINENATRSDRSANAQYASEITNRWLNVRLEGLTSITVLVTALLVVSNRGSLSPSLAGLALSNTLSLTYSVIWTLRGYCDLASSLVAVERIHEYSNKRMEAPENSGVRLPENWPQNGRIVFKNYSARYREGLDLVLKNVSFEVKPAEKIGVVGRTGAGKSSLTLALFRIIEAADSYWARTTSAQEDLLKDNPTLIDGGSIEIDGVDISTLGLRELRQHLSIIPQEPMLFAGTIRDNLDPFHKVTDAELWEALERAHLKDHISSLEGGLSAEVAQNGENFSVGQRSLICLARALLCKTKILVLDEATAAVDVETDDLIQQTIRKEFKDRTILTIAHRIKTIMDSDKILVLDRGQVQEYGSPTELLQTQGLFYSLAKQAGQA
ncbi:Multidrug resistance-associated protein 1 [Modicella reniformis]|uniref:Multidrug resistance-associated protein 1 n=1 Tax=Modicella reniformis TaxID=1440133 RepID=A0A9P6LU06_9FUNG|nr:Multidrug resistance-associated protein 1 [Modicella reniformis]